MRLREFIDPTTETSARLQHVRSVARSSSAPIFELVDFGVVGDLHTVLPAATEEINKRSSSI